MDHVEEGENTLLRALGNGAIVEMDGVTGRALMEFTVKPEFCHSGNICQGGFVTGWLDSAMAHAAMAMTEGKFSPASLEIKISFLRSALKGERVRAEGRVKRLGKSTAFLEGALRNAKGELIATTSSTARLVPMQNGS